MAAEARQEGHEGGALQQTAAEGIRHRDVPRAQGTDEPGHAEHGVVPQFQRVAKIVVHAAKDDVHRFQAAKGFQKNAVIAHREVLPLHERVAEVPGEIRLLEIRFVVRAGRQHHHAGIVRAARRQAGQRILDFAEPRGEALHAAIAESFEQIPRSDEAVRQRVAGARGDLRAVRHHPPLAIRRARQIGGVEMEVGAVHRADAVLGSQKIRLGEQQGRRQPARTDEILRAVAVGEDAIEERGTLDKGALQLGPLPFPDDKGNRIEIPRALNAPRVAIHIVGDSLLQHEPARSFRAAAHLGRAERIKLLHECLPMLADITRPALHFVKSRPPAGVTGGKSAGGGRGWTRLGHGDGGHRLSQKAGRECPRKARKGTQRSAIFRKDGRLPAGFHGG